MENKIDLERIKSQLCKELRVAHDVDGEEEWIEIELYYAGEFIENAQIDVENNCLVV